MLMHEISLKKPWTRLALARVSRSFGQPATDHERQVGQDA